MLPTLAVTTARVLPGDSLWWVILRACAPVAILPYFVAATLLGVMWAGLRGTARTTGMVALVVVASLLLLHVWWFAKPFLADAPGAMTGDAFVVMSANLHLGRADPQTVIDTVVRDDVDVLVLVEVTPSALTQLDAAGLGERLQHRAGAPASNRDGIMVFSRAPLGVVTAVDTASPGFSVEATTGDGPLTIFAVHPTAPNNGVAQWREDLDVVVAAARASKGATVVAGDFNATLDHPPLQSLLGSSFRDASSEAGIGWRPTWPSGGDGGRFGAGMPPLFALDHVFVRGGLAATDAHVTAVPGTDHRALVTRIAWTDASISAGRGSTQPGG